METTTTDLTVRSYNHKLLDLTIIKSSLINDLLIEYRKVANIILNKQIKSLYTTGNLNTKDSKEFYGSIKSFLSERYKDVIKRQVDGMLKSYISNRKNDFKSIVYKSNLTNDQKKELYLINKSNNWFIKENLLARKIFKHILSKNKFPSTKSINMVLNTKVYDIQPNKETKECSYLIRLRTCNKNHPMIFLPLKSNTYFNKELSKSVKLNNSIQINFKKNKLKNIVISTSKIKHKTISNTYLPKTDKISFDFGLRNLLTTNKGDFFSRNFIDKLIVYDKKILNISKELNKRKIKLNTNKRYVDYNRCLRAFIDNEINRVVNRIFKIYKPKEIILEGLNFVGVGLSRRMNRLLTNCGLNRLKVKLQTLSEDYGIKITYINPAYTSQECSRCSYVDRENRKTRDIFKCLCCGHKSLADINASKTIINRVDDGWFIANVYATKHIIKQHLLEKNRMFVESNNSRLSKAISRVKELIL